MKTPFIHPNTASGAPRIPRSLTPLAFGLLTLSLLGGLLAGCDSAGPEDDPEALDLEAADLEDEDGPLWGDPGVSFEAAVRQAGAAKTADRFHWGDAYLWAFDATSPSYSASSSSYSFNRTGGGINITRPAGTTGRYRVEFPGINHFLGLPNTLQVTGYSSDNVYCKAATPRTKGNVAQIRCYDAASGAAANGLYTVLAMRNYTDVAFAYANKPGGNNYAPLASSAWNPTGQAIRIFRSGVGVYRVQFNGLGSLLTANGGHVQITAVGGDKAHCKVGSWGGSPDLNISVLCFNQAGAPANAKFNVFFAMPSAPLAYTWASQPTNPGYNASTFYSSNSGGGAVTISRGGVGLYTITFNGLSGTLLDGGHVQVTAYGGGNAQCKVTSWGSQTVNVRCFMPNGANTDTFFTALLTS